MDELVGKDKRMDEVSTSARSVNDGTVAIALDGQSLDHWHSVVWDPGIVGSQGLSVCYDCLCSMALFRAVMSLLHDWAEWSVWTGTISGYCRTITWKVGDLPRLHPPCDVDRLCDYMAWQIKGPVVAIMTDGDENNSPQLRWGSYPREGFRSWRLVGSTVGAGARHD